MARGGVTLTQVDQAARYLQGQGKNPTVDAIREYLGTGSRTTLAEWLRQWKAQQTEGAAGNLPEPLVALVSGLWGNLQSQAQARIDQQQAQWLAEKTVLETQLAQTVQAEQQQSEALQQLQQTLTAEQLQQLAVHLDTAPTLAAVRDNALIQIGFFGALRRSELVAIRWQDVKFVPEGVEILIVRSKTDPEARGEICAIPYGSAPLCPVTALLQWQADSNLTDGCVFRGIQHDRIQPKGLSPATVNQILKRRAIELQWPEAEHYSGHSLRRGFATAASQRGAAFNAIMRQGRWRHQATVYGYIQDSQKFENNAAAAILKNKR